MDRSHLLDDGAQPAPLQLSQLTIRRFRSLHDVGPLPIQAALTVLTGENDGGKTTCLDAIDFLLGGGPLEDADRSRWAGDDEPIEVEGLFYAFDDPGETTPLRFRARQECGGHRVCEVLVGAHRHFGPQWVNTPLPELKERMIAAGITLPRVTKKDPFIDAVTAWLIDRPKDEWDDRWRPASQSELRRLPKLTRFRAAEAQDPEATVKQVAARESRLLLAQPRYADRLGKLSKELDSDIAPSLARIKEKIREHLPDIDDIEVTASFDFSKPTPQVRLQMCRRGEHFDLDKGGEGRRRVTLAIYEATLTTMAAGQAVASELIAYDEPDTHLDVAAQRILFDILDRHARFGHVQVLVATHAKSFIDKVPLQALLHFQLDGELKTRVEALASYGHADELAFLARVCAGIGLRNSVLLDERCFLVVEGETEEAAIPDLFRLVTGQSLTTVGINVMNAKGSGSIRSAVTTLAKDWGREVAVLADADANDGTHQGGVGERWLAELGLRDGEGANFVGSKEFEDAFTDEVWLRALRAHFPPTDGGADWNLDELAALRQAGTKKYSEALLGLVRRRRRGDHTIRKPDLGFALAGVCTEEDIPVPLRECFAFVLALARRARGAEQRNLGAPDRVPDTIHHRSSGARPVRLVDEFQQELAPPINAA